MKAKPRSEKYVWVTWLTRLMVGETTCEWSPWFKTRNQLLEKAASDFDQISWQIDHTRMLRELRQQLEKEGKEVFLNAQNWFRLSVGNLLLAGKPDLIALSEKEVEIYDCKTGQPKDSDQIQVMIYMFCLPKARPELVRERPLKGYVVYENQRVEILAEKIDERFEQNLQYFLDFLANDQEPKRRPSRECRFCDIAKSDCPERIEKIEKIIEELPEC